MSEELQDANKQRPCILAATWRQPLAGAKPMPLTHAHHLYLLSLNDVHARTRTAKFPASMVIAENKSH
jgi:hypothetical protein